MQDCEISLNDAILPVRPWTDSVIDQIGHDPRSDYVERFWLGILGPSVTWLLRYLANQLDSSPDGFELDLEACATAIGLGRLQGPNAAFPRTVHRCCQFGTGRVADDGALEVRRKLPPLTLRQIARLPAPLRDEHANWVGETPGNVPHLRNRARRLALSLLELGEDREATERQLQRWRFRDTLVSDATQWALERLAERSTKATGTDHHVAARTP